MSFAGRRILITGGAGFIGTNLADRALSDGAHVTILDNTSRPGVTENLERLRAMHPRGPLHFEGGDVRDAVAVRQAMKKADAVFHFAAQVAVTTSVVDPAHDFAVNL